MGVRAREENIACCIHSFLTQEEHVLQVGVKALGSKVDFAVAEGAIPVGTKCSAVRIFGSERRIE